MTQAAAFPSVRLTLARTVSSPIKSLVTCRSTLLSTGPAQLKGPFDSTGFPVGCKSACEAGLAPDPNNDPNCCTGRYDTAATCPSSGVQYYSYFSEFSSASLTYVIKFDGISESTCPDTYVYAYDESSGTALFSCAASKQADYTITFCP